MSFDRSLLTFNPDNHGHYYDGKRLLGVTTALGIISKGDGLLQWAANCSVDYIKTNIGYDDEGDIISDAQDFEIILQGARYAWRSKRQEAATIGTLTHNWIEDFLKGKDPAWPEDPHVVRACEAALQWIRSVKWETIEIEHQIYIPELGVGGICDWYARINGVPTVPDWKTSKALYPSYAYQTAAYLKALEAELGEKIQDRWLVRIDKETGEVDPRLLGEETLEKHYKAFTDAVSLYRIENEVKKEWQK